MIFEQLNPHACRTYLVANAEKGRAVLVDPVLDHFSDYLSLLERRGLVLTHVIDTHTHADHISAAAALKDRTGCAYIMHESAPARCVDIRVREGDLLDLNGIKFDVVHTPGHTKDSISLIVGGMFLTGDFLFLDDAGAGRDDLPGGSAVEHWESLSKISEFPDDLLVCPAHEYRGREISTLGRQKESNPHLVPRTKDEFVRYIEGMRLGPTDWMKDVLGANYACAMDPAGVWIPADLPACELKGTLEKSVNEIEVASISPQSLRALIGSGKAPLLIDVREPEELSGEMRAIDGALNVPIGSLASRLGELSRFRDREIVVVCRSGARALTGAQILTKAGFVNVKVLEGGMLAFRQA